jgi:hypothetical protein
VAQSNADVFLVAKGGRTLRHKIDRRTVSQSVLFGSSITQTRQHIIFISNGAHRYLQVRSVPEQALAPECQPQRFVALALFGKPPSPVIFSDTSLRLNFRKLFFAFVFSDCIFQFYPCRSFLGPKRFAKANSAFFPVLPWPSSCANVHRFRLHNDLEYRWNFNCKFMGFGEDDIKTIKACGMFLY